MPGTRYAATLRTLIAKIERVSDGDILIIEQPAVIEKLLSHLGPWIAQAYSPPAGYPLPFSLQRVVAA